MAFIDNVFSELHKIMVKKAAFVGFIGGDRPNQPLDPPMSTNSSNEYGWSAVLMLKLPMWNPTNSSLDHLKRRLPPDNKASKDSTWIQSNV